MLWKKSWWQNEWKGSMYFTESQKPLIVRCTIILRTTKEEKAVQIKLCHPIDWKTQTDFTDIKV